MAKKKQTDDTRKKLPAADNVVGLRAEITEQPIVDTLEMARQLRVHIGVDPEGVIEPLHFVEPDQLLREMKED